MSVPVAPASGDAPKKSRTLLYILAGCGGCLALGGLCAVVLLIFASMATKKAVTAGQSASLQMKVRSQELLLTVYLVDDEPRLKRMKKSWDELSKAAKEGELKLDDIQSLQTEIDSATNDDKLSADEADSILEHGEKLSR